MKTKTQIENALWLEIAPRASDALERLSQMDDARRDLRSQIEFTQACAVVDALRWVLGDGDRSDLPIGDYLLDRARAEDLMAFLDRFSRSARN